MQFMLLTDPEGRVLFCSPVRPGSCADITQAWQWIVAPKGLQVDPDLMDQADHVGAFSGAPVSPAASAAAFSGRAASAEKPAGPGQMPGG
ncbi:hypothetical protein OHB00_41350 [Streptomyces sp. NBC_00631]|uniref:hypothetical protein n=1 Tax=Streptomyces sp. NBC_00631 TaxID=2975793 RepID=UPI0030DEC173